MVNRLFQRFNPSGEVYWKFRDIHTFLRKALSRNAHCHVWECTALLCEAHFAFGGWTLSQESVRRSRETVAERKFLVKIAGSIARNVRFESTVLWNLARFSLLSPCISLNIHTASASGLYSSVSSLQPWYYAEWCIISGKKMWKTSLFHPPYSQSLAQFASAQRCQAGPLLHEQVGKEEVCDGQLAYEQTQHLIWSNQDLAREVCCLLDTWWVWKLWEET